MRRFLRLVLYWSLLAATCTALSSPPPRACTKSTQVIGISQRRTFISSALASVGLLLASSQTASAATTRGQVTLTLQSPKDRVGLELFNVVIGTPGMPVVAIRRVVSNALVDKNNNQLLQPGMILRDYPYATDVQERLAKGPYPVQLTFSNLAAAGDAISDLGTPLVTAQDALDLARRTSSSSANSGTTSTSNSNTDTDMSAPTPYGVTLLRDIEEKSCNIPSRRNDVLEIMYQARIGGPDGIVYDASATRGTGQPYQMVLGSGDMLPGVDQGLYDFCPGQVRSISIPPALAYGVRGNKMFRVPANTPIYWLVELVSVNSVRKGDTRTRDEMEGRYQ
jgi:FK506-binding protein 2